MFISWLEQIMYQVSGLFLAPVLLLLFLLFIYSLYALGDFLMMAWLRRRNRLAARAALRSLATANGFVPPPGFPVYAAFADDPDLDRDGLDVAALKELETVRLISRVAPMLGLIATMVPMGPALKSLANGNIQGISENLIIAFAAVIFGLVVASIAFTIASYKKRWLAEELVQLLRIVEGDEIKLASQADLQSSLQSNLQSDQQSELPKKLSSARGVTA